MGQKNCHCAAQLIRCQRPQILRPFDSLVQAVRHLYQSLLHCPNRCETAIQHTQLNEWVVVQLPAPEKAIEALDAARQNTEQQKQLWAPLQTTTAELHHLIVLTFVQCPYYF